MYRGTLGETPTGVRKLAPSVRHLPPDVRGSRISTVFYRDYQAVVRAIATVLDKPGVAGLPTTANVQTELRGRARRFFGKGGRVEHALDYVLRSAKDVSFLGDGTWDDARREDAAENVPGGLEYAALPTCDNDLAFSCVADKLTLAPGNSFEASERLGYDFPGFLEDGAEEFEEEYDEAMELEDREIVDSLVQTLRLGEAARGRV